MYKHNTGAVKHHRLQACLGCASVIRSASIRVELALWVIPLCSEPYVWQDVALCRQDSIQAAQQQVQAAVGDSGLQLLVNNAGLGMVAPVEFFPLDGFR